MSGAQPPAVPVFYAGFPPTQQLNAMGTAFAFLLAKVVFRARRAGTGAVTRNGQTAVPWDSIDEDPLSGWAAASPTLYTVQTPGWYIVSTTASVTGAAAAGWVLIPSFAVNGGSLSGQGAAGWEGPELFPPIGATDPKASGGLWDGYCNPGDQISVNTFVSSEPAANLAWQTTPGAQTNIEIVWMSV